MSAALVFLDQLSDHLFWDLARSSVDPDANERFLVGRIIYNSLRYSCSDSTSPFACCLRRAYCNALGKGDDEL